MSTGHNDGINFLTETNDTLPILICSSVFYISKYLIAVFSTGCCCFYSSCGVNPDYSIPNIS